MLMGGPANGQVVEFDTREDVIVWPAERSFLDDDPDAFSVDYDTYRYQKLATPDRWVQVVYVHSGVDLDRVPESDMIRAIMTVWRARHRKAAEEGRTRLPSGFTLTREMIE
jgi:hypothetical protein